MRNAQVNARKLLDAAQKAHDAMGELVEANAERHDSYLRWEEVRRRSTSRAKKLESALASSQEALKFWETRLQGNDFDDLLANQERVLSGGPSSKSIARTKKETNRNIPGGEEE
jgi:hypothetical protein